MKFLYKGRSLDRFLSWIAAHNSANNKTIILQDREGKDHTFTVTPDGPYCYVGMHRSGDNTVYEFIGDPDILRPSLAAAFPEIEILES